MRVAATTSSLRTSLLGLLLMATLVVAHGARADSLVPIGPSDPDGGDAVQIPGGMPILPMVPTPPGATTTPTSIGLAILNNGGNGVAGLSFNQSGGYVPPDCQGAAGPFGIVETVNQSIGLYSPRTALLPQVQALSNFYFTVGGLPHASVGSGLSDPVVAYNAQIGRFVVADQDVDFNNHVSRLDVAVSRSNNPTTLTVADWYFFSIVTTEANFDADYPGNIGYNFDATVITLNMFPTGPGATHVQVLALSNASLTAAAPVVVKTDRAGFGLRPAVFHDAVAGSPMWLVTEHGDGLSIDVLKMTNVLSAAPTYTTTVVPVTPYGGANPPLNPNASTITFNIDSRILSAATWGGQLVATHTVSTGATTDAAQWYEFNITSGTPALTQVGQVSAGNNTYVTYPGIDINSISQIGMSFMRSGTDVATDYMSMYVTGRNPTDALGTMMAPIAVPAGAGQANYADFAGGRAGDLSGINVDPVDLSSFWAVNEFANTQAVANWGTAIANFAVNEQPVATLLTRFDAAWTAGGVTVRWEFGPGVDLTNASLERATNDQGPWFRVAGAPSQANGVTQLTDPGAPTDAAPLYRLVVTRQDGSLATFGPVTTTGTPPTLDFALRAIGPNPGRGATRIAYTVPRETRVRITMHDVQGRELGVLVDGNVDGGRHEAQLRAGEGGAPRAGICFVRMSWAGGSRTQRVILLP